MGRPAIRFAVIFFVSIIVVSVLLRLDAVDEQLVVPFTSLIARASSATLNLAGMSTQVTGTQIRDATGFSINILNGCNAVYVSGILLCAVLAFPSSLKEKLIGAAIGLSGVQLINLIRIVSLFMIGLKRPDLFDQFHLYFWQTAVVVLSMTFWIFWAEVLVSKPGGSRAAAGH